MGVAAGIAAALAAAGAAGMTMKAKHDKAKAAKRQAVVVKQRIAETEKNAKATTYDAEKEEQKAARVAATADKMRELIQTDTIRTSALGDIGSVETKKKTLLGG